MKLANKDFMTLQEFTKEELEEFLEYTLKVKHKKEVPSIHKKSVLSLLLTPSIHDRIIMETAVQQLNGRNVMIDFSKDKWLLLSDEDAAGDGEYIKDVACMLSDYCDCLAVRHIPDSKQWLKDRQDSVIKAFAKYTSLPMINLELALFNPCQGLADVLTIKEHLRNVKGWKAVLMWTHQPTSQPMSIANSFALAASKCGLDITVACPPGYELDPAILKFVDKNARLSGGSLDLSHNFESAVNGAHIIYAVNWRSIKYYASPEEEKTYGNNFTKWKIMSELMQKTDGAYLMHPFPARRNICVMPEVLDSKKSLVYEQAKNRLHVQKALLASLIGA